MKVSTAEFVKNYGALADRALVEPITITKNGRDRLVVLSAAAYERLRRSELHGASVGDHADEEIAAIARTTGADGTAQEP